MAESRLPVLRQEDGGLVAPAGELGPRAGQVDGERFASPPRERDDPVLVPLAVADEQAPGAEVDVGEVEPHALAHPEPCPVEQLEDRAVSLPLHRSVVRHAHEAPRGGFRHCPREPPPHGQRHTGRGVHEQHPPPLEKAEEGLHDREVLRLRTGSERRPGVALKGRKATDEADQVRLADPESVVDALGPQVIEEARQDTFRVLSGARSVAALADRLDVGPEESVEVASHRPLG